MTTVLRRLALLAAAAATTTLMGGGVASAHLAVEAPGAKAGSSAVLSFRISNESEQASTTALTVELPGLKTARTEPLPGWTATVVRDSAKMATSVTWTATAEAAVGPGQFQRFFLYAGPLPAQDTIAFRAVQTYSDGTVETWDQPSPSGAPEPEFPLPVLTLSAQTAGQEHSHNTDSGAPSTQNHADPDSDSDSAARWLAAAGLVVALLGGGAAVMALARTRSASR